MTEERKGHLVLVGTGLRTVGHMTTEAIAWIQAADKVLYVVGDPIAEEMIHTLNPNGAESLQDLYGEGKDRIDTYNEMVERILACVREGKRVCGVFYGHPGVFVYPSHEAINRARAEGFSAVMLPGVSAEDCLFADLGIDPAAAGCQSYEATDYLFNVRRTDPSSGLVLWQIGILGNTSYSASGRYDTSSMPLLIAKLSRLYRHDHVVIAYEAAVHLGCQPRITQLPLAHLANVDMSAATTLYIPPSMAPLPDQQVLAQLRQQQQYMGQYQMPAWQNMPTGMEQPSAPGN